jgi:metal-responsive CopG/Arc/MetJ family transcriptional regulator
VSGYIIATTMSVAESAGTGGSGKKSSDWTPVSLPKGLVSRIDAVFGKLGYRSRAEYVRHAILKQLDGDERLGRDGGNELGAKP